MKSILSIMMAFMLASCSGSYEAAKTYNVEKERAYPKPYDAVWTKCVEWFATHNTPIKTLDKSSGIIASEYSLSFDSYKSYCDCGTGGGGLVSKTLDAPAGNITILVKTIDGSQTSVSISTFFRSILKTVNNYSGKAHDSRPVDCNSTGKLEREFLDYISQ